MLVEDAVGFLSQMSSIIQGSFFWPSFLLKRSFGQSDKLNLLMTSLHPITVKRMLYFINLFPPFLPVIFVALWQMFGGKFFFFNQTIFSKFALSYIYLAFCMVF